MPGTRCTVAVCNNSYDKTKRAGIKIKYHKFPTVQPVRDIWIERTGRGGKWNPDSCHICSAHFKEDDYRQDLCDFPNKVDTKRLRPTAVPSLFLTEPPPINITLLTPRKRRKISLSDRTPSYSNEDNIMYSQDILNHTDGSIKGMVT
ncbi:peroxynitrite isomerase THAP4-like isoform X2 [Phymastichus coffea]|uniref:peroxynitrite isomerase THAP4-like isoform X2 n=1 Tax=Phymastichus coffea TaxID=108790 RepID=UPI00273BDE22|nr:peroxynitrite isomerase THAP4-like isoform X2 [Phymastichus coffea]